MDATGLRTALLAQLDDNMDWVRDIAALFLETSPRMLADIQVAVASRDASALERTAHRIKGSLRTFCSEEAGAAAEALEAMGEAGNLAEAELALGRLERALVELHALVRELL